jgi:hypothetical protein
MPNVSTAPECVSASLRERSWGNCSSSALVPSRAQDGERIRQRRELAWRLRLEGHSLSAIRGRLAQRGFVVDVSQVSRDLAHVRRDTRRTFDRTHFDPVGFVVDQVQRFELLYAKAMRDTRRTRNVAERCVCYRTASHVLEQINALLADAGVVDSRVAMLLRAAADGEAVEPIPSGIELQRLFANVTVTQDDAP